MNGGDFLAAGGGGEAESVLGDTQRRGASDHLDAGDDAGNHFVLDAGVQVFGVLAENHHVDLDVGEARGDAGQRVHGSHISVEVEALAQSDVDAGEAASDGRGDGALEADAGSVQAIEDAFGKRLAGLENKRGVELGDFPIDGDAGGIDGAAGGPRDFRTDTIAGNQSYKVRHLPMIAHDALGRALIVLHLFTTFMRKDPAVIHTAKPCCMVPADVPTKSHAAP